MARYPRDPFVRHVGSRDDLLPFEHIPPGMRPSHHQAHTEIAITTEEEHARGLDRERAARAGGMRS